MTSRETESAGSELEEMRKKAFEIIRVDKLWNRIERLERELRKK